MKKIEMCITVFLCILFIVFVSRKASAAELRHKACVYDLVGMTCQNKCKSYLGPVVRPDGHYQYTSNWWCHRDCLLDIFGKELRSQYLQNLCASQNDAESFVQRFQMRTLSKDSHIIAPFTDVGEAYRYLMGR